MNAGVVKPGQKDGAKVVEIAIPLPRRDEVLVKMLEAGIDGTDMEINGGHYGESPSGQDFLVLGHEALGKIENPGTTEFSKGELVVPLVTAPWLSRQ